jgi:hypothetical protein
MMKDQELCAYIEHESRVLVHMDCARRMEKNPDVQEILDKYLQDRILKFVLLLLRECEHVDYSPSEMAQMVEEPPIDYVAHPDQLTLVAREALPIHVMRCLIRCHNLHISLKNPAWVAWMARYGPSILD